jgi:hypothetical protein
VAARTPVPPQRRTQEAGRAGNNDFHAAPNPEAMRCAFAMIV